MFKRIREIKRTLDTSIDVGEGHESALRKAVITAVVLLTVGIVISVVNVVQGAYNIAVYPFVFFVWGVIILVLAVKYKSRAGVTYVTIPVVVISMTALVLLSDNGFAYLWTLLIPICVSYLFSVKAGIYLTIYFQIFFIVLFYTPARKLVEDHYPEIAMSRFPLLFFFHGVMVLVSMYSYHKSVLFELRHTQEALDLSEAKTNFLASMSHEIRTPINAILGMNEMIIRENKDPVIGEYADSVRNSGQMLLMLVNDVLDFSKIEAGKMEIHEAPFTMSMMLHGIMPMIEERAAEKSLMLNVRITDEIPDGMISDEFRIRQVLINLLNNAIKYTDAGSVDLILGGEYTGDDSYQLTMSVKDTGRGISEAAQKNLFEAFSRADLNENRNIEGTGLGLAIVKKILDSMNGTIAVDSTYGEGSEFIVQLPVKVTDRTPLKEDYEDQVKTVVSDIDKNDYFAPDAAVLAVDDNASNLRIVSLFLKRVGIVPELAKSGTAAIELCTKRHYDLLLLDHRMPDPDGIRTLEIIRNSEDSLNKDTPAVVLTANALAGSDKIYSEAGFIDYLTKPIDSMLLEQTVKKYLPEDKIQSPDDDGYDDVMVFKAVPSADSDGVQTGASDLRNKLEKIEGLDYDEALHLAGGHEDLLKETASIIASECDEKIIRMRECIASEDTKGYELVAHSIKGLMASLGLKDMSERAKKHENAAIENDTEFIRSDGEAFIEAYKEICTRLK